MTYEVIVGNIGTVYSGPSKSAAERDFEGYVRQSREGYGRAANEPVTLMCAGEPVKEYEPAEQPEQDDTQPVMVDITPDSLKTPEGRARAAAAQQEWDHVANAPEQGETK